MTQTMERAPSMDQAKIAEILEKLKDSPMARGEVPAEVTTASKSTTEPTATPTAASAGGNTRAATNNVSDFNGTNYIDKSCYIYHYQTDRWIHYSNTEFYAGVQAGYYHYTFAQVDHSNILNTLRTNQDNDDLMITDMAIRHPVNTPCSYVIWSYSGFSRLYQGNTQYNAATGDYEIVVPFMKVLAAETDTYCIEVLNNTFATIESNVLIDFSYIDTTDVSYGTYASQTFDLHMPSGYAPGYAPSSPLPAVLTIHGGNWTGGSKAYFNQSAYVDRIIGSGCVQININYQLIDTDNSTNPSLNNMLADIKAAIEYVADNYGGFIDTNKLALMGYSAGGHLALMYTFRETSSPIPINLVISEAGPTCLHTHEETTVTINGDDFPCEIEKPNNVTYWLNVYKWLLGNPNMALTANHNALKDISPLDEFDKIVSSEDPDAISAVPSTLLVYSPYDETVHDDHGLLLADKLISNGVDCTFVLLDDTAANIEHGNFEYAYSQSENYYNAWRTLITEYKNNQ